MIYKLSLKFQAELEFCQIIVLSVAPFKVIPPPSAVKFVGTSTKPNSIFLSSICIVVSFTVEKLPFTVRSPSICACPVTCKSASGLVVPKPNLPPLTPKIPSVSSTKELSPLFIKYTLFFAIILTFYFIRKLFMLILYTASNCFGNKIPYKNFFQMIRVCHKMNYKSFIINHPWVCIKFVHFEYFSIKTKPITSF